MNTTVTIATNGLAVGLPERWRDVREWAAAAREYVSSMSGDSQIALAVFVGAMAIAFAGVAYVRRRRLAVRRDRIPLSIGGWGTRGKSGTERIKAGMFHGLGYDVLCKTTGCEAMFIHSVAGRRSEEVFIFRPFDKATIWEQADLVGLAADIGAEVFLWECMALNPRYVAVLQRGWMRDEIATITNAFPDHEDVQGPAGIDVARTIAHFVPERATVLSSEVGFQPLFEETCRERDSTLIPVPVSDADLVTEDLLELFPYREHPHNIALVARMAEELGIDRDLAIVTMAEHVVPDLGVLKAYPTVRFRGRRLTFINAMSANERTGFVTSWRRMGLAGLDPDTRPKERVVSVVNNRADRIPRSEVFARILTHDVDVDRHVLIGTNLKGLRGYLAAALEELAHRRPIFAPGSGSIEEARERLAEYVGKVRIPSADPDVALAHLEVFAEGCGVRWTADGLARLRTEIDRTLAGAAGADPSLERAAAAIGGDAALLQAIADTVPREATRDDDPEVLEAPDAEQLAVHARELLARMRVRRTLECGLERALSDGTEASRAAFEASFRGAFLELFRASLVVVDDAATSGDRIVDLAAGAVPPGTNVALVGMQNIKGTGLDFAYRFIALDQIDRVLERVRSDRAEVRADGLDALLAVGDYGVLGAGLVVATLERLEALETLDDAGPDETRLREAARARARAAREKALAALTATGGSSWAASFAGRIEGLVEAFDVVRNRRAARRVLDDLVHGRVTHARAATEMRAIVARQKGGWLAKAMARRFEDGARAARRLRTARKRPASARTASG